VFALGVLLVLVNVVRGLVSGVRANANPWGAPTLEWAVPSPPPAYNFAELPIVASRYPLWEPALAAHEGTRIASDIRLEGGRETFATSALDAEIDLVAKMPEDSLAPLWLTVGLSIGFVGLLLHAWAIVAIGGALSLIAIVLWLWPRANMAQIAENAR